MTKPHILLIVSDQERQRDWLPAGADLPARPHWPLRGFGGDGDVEHSACQLESLEEGGAAPRPIGQTGIVPTVPSMDNPMKRMRGFQSYLNR